MLKSKMILKFSEVRRILKLFVVRVILQNGNAYQEANGHVEVIYY